MDGLEEVLKTNLAFWKFRSVCSTGYDDEGRLIQPYQMCSADQISHDSLPDFEIESDEYGWYDWV